MNEYEKMWWGICENGKCSVWRSSLWTQHHCPMALWSWYDLTHTVVLPTLSSGFWIQWIGPWETKDLLGLEWMMHKKQNQYHFLNINYFLWRMIMCVLVMSCVPHSSIMQTLFIQGFEEGGKKESQFWFRSIHEFLYWKIQDSTH